MTISDLNKKKIDCEGIGQVTELSILLFLVISVMFFCLVGKGITKVGFTLKF